MMEFEQIKRSVSPLEPKIWQIVNRRMIVKIIAELMHEDILHPEPKDSLEDGLTNYVLRTKEDLVNYQFSAYTRALHYWHILPESVTRIAEISGNPISAIEFLTELALDIDGYTMAMYIEELSRTLYADAVLWQDNKPSSKELAAMDFQQIEHHMEGHPWYIVNKGRIGFNYDEYNSYAPERGGLQSFLWIAVHKSRASFEHVYDYSADVFFREEIGEDIYSAFGDTIKKTGKNVEDYFFMPVNEWQWKNKILFLFSEDISNKMIIPLEVSSKDYSPQQSIRTYFNLVHTNRRYVKTSMSILNTSSYRGLPTGQMSIAPALTIWLKQQVGKDAFLKENGLILLGENATVAYKHPYFSAMDKAPYHFKEMLGALWRENPLNKLKSGERIMSLAALLYVDKEGLPFLDALIKQSGLEIKDWLKYFLVAYLHPVLHLYYAHSICVNPHGENVLLVLKNNVPSRIALKDFVGDILLNEEAQKKLPPRFTANMVLSSNPENVPLVILIGVFESYFRYLADILATFVGFAENNFWKLVYESINKYQHTHPELEAKFRKYELFIPSFKRLNMNSQRLFNGYKNTSGFERAKKNGELINPIYAFYQPK